MNIYDYANLSYLERARLKKSDPATYSRVRGEHTEHQATLERQVFTERSATKRAEILGQIERLKAPAHRDATVASQGTPPPPPPAATLQKSLAPHQTEFRRPSSLAEYYAERAGIIVGYADLKSAPPAVRAAYERGIRRRNPGGDAA